MGTDMDTDLISMAEIAKLADQSRSTVGNWKARQSDFPTERGQSSRGPLYDRSEVIEWLTRTGRIPATRGADQFAWRLMDTLRGTLRSDDALDLACLLLGVKTAAQNQSPQTWTTLVNTPSDQIATALDRSIHELLPFISELYDSQLRSASSDTQHLLSLLDSYDTQGDRARPLLDSLMTLLTNSIGGIGAEHSSPTSLRRLLVNLAEPSGTVYDPGAGLGQLLVDAAALKAPDLQLLGQEVNRRAWELGTLNLFLRGISADYQCGDIFGEDAFPGLLADLVLSVLPFNPHIPVLDHLQDDPRWLFGEPGPMDGNVAWIQHCLHHLAQNGRAFLVLPQKVLFEGGRSGRIRQRIIKADLLDAVVSLPGGLFSTTSIPAVLLVFERARQHAGAPSTPGPVLMIDAADFGEKRGRKETVLPEASIERISEMYHSWRDGDSTIPDECSSVATFDAIVNNDFVIDPKRYVAGPTSFVDEKALFARKVELQKTLVDAMRASTLADEKLLHTLGGDR